VAESGNGNGSDESGEKARVVKSNVRRLCAHEEGPFHDCTYVRAVNALINDAVILSNREAVRLGIGERDARRSGLYHAQIDRLTHERGIRKTVGSVLAGVVQADRASLTDSRH